MNASIEELLRDGLLRFTADLHAPADLAGRAKRRRNHRRMLRTVTASGAAAAAVVAITVAAVGAGTARQSSRDHLPPARPSAAPLDIEYIRFTPSGKFNSQLTWAYGQRSRQRISSWTGQPIEDDGFTVLSFRHGLVHEIRSIVEYASKTWASGKVTTPQPLAPPNHACEHPAFSYPGGPQALPTWIRRLRYLVGCGELAIAGTGRIGGVKVIKVVQVGPTLKPGLWETIWVRQGSYVPVRVAGGDGQFSWRVDISWLRPTKANLALLTVPIPAGFRRTSFSDFPNAILPPTIVICHPEPSNPNVRICGTPS
jgi:hypothetical protein